MSNSPQYTHARLRTRQLLLLTVLVEGGNVYWAAATLNVTQPAASRLLRELEAMLGVQLFEHMPRGMRLTYCDDMLAHHTRAVVGSLDQAQEEVFGLKAGRLGHVAVGAITSLGMRLLPPVVAQIMCERSGLWVSLEIESSNALFERLAQGKLDLVVSRLFAEHDKLYLHYEPLADEPVVVAARSRYPLPSELSLTLVDVQTVTWVASPISSVLRYRLDLMLQWESLTTPSSVVETSVLFFLTCISEQSDMLVVIGTDVAQYHASYRMLAIFPLSMPCRMDDLGIIMHTDRLLSPTMLHVVQALRDVGRTAYSTE